LTTASNPPNIIAEGNISSHSFAVSELNQPHL
jgi:hypothetical protein